jgi:SAM-dependent methyltransferase
MKLVDAIHGNYVASRRTCVLSRHISRLIPSNARVLDVGCGDGKLSHLVLRERADIDLHGIEVLVRGDEPIPVEPFDGRSIPHADGSFDCVLFVDVLHHTDDPMLLLREAVRVARQCILIKDHTLEGLWAGPTLRFMDRVGNARYGVALPFNYWPRRRWDEAFDELNLAVDFWEQDLGLYPWPACHVFGRSLHFIARLVPRERRAPAGAPAPNR